MDARASVGACLTAVIAAALLAACATVPAPPDAEVRARFGRMVVVPAASPGSAPRTQILSGRGEEIPPEVPLSPTEEGLLAGGIVAGGYATVAPYPPVGVILIASSLFVGGMAAAFEKVSSRELDALDARLATALAEPAPDARLAAAIEQAAADPATGQGHALSRTTEDPDMRLEVTLRVAGFKGTEDGLRLYLIATTRLVDRAGTVLHAREFLHTSARRKVPGWQAGGGEAIGAALDAAFPELAERIVDELFLVTRNEFGIARFALPGQPGYGVCVLEPLEPPLRFRWPRFAIPFTEAAYERMTVDMIEYPRVASIAPTLRWEPFPRPVDRTPRNAALVARISAVTYDLKVWAAKGGEPQRLVYERRGLTAPEHALEEPLAPGQDHFWSIRARYRLDDAPQATRWAHSFVPMSTGPPQHTSDVCERDPVHPHNYYRFRTPKLIP